MDILVSGSIAYDRIMDFPGRFADHIMPDKIHMINLSFMVDGVKENFGGTAGNIAYALSLLGEKPRIISTIGYDHHIYFDWLKKNGLATQHIRIITDEPTASAFITTDKADNQITGFNPGAMKRQTLFDFAGINPAQTFAIVAPGNQQDMIDLTEQHHRRGIFNIFDPGQTLPIWSGPDLLRCVSQSRLLIANDYEMALIQEKTGLKLSQLQDKVETIITTRSEHGAEVLTKGERTLIPPIKTANVVDPTGAGDAFRGGLIKGLLEGKPAVRAAQMGTVCAHHVIQVYGTQTYRFTPEQFQAKLREHFGD